MNRFANAGPNLHANGKRCPLCPKPDAVPVDVLAVMDSDAKEADFSRKRAASPYVAALAKDSAEARAAVAALDEKARAILAAANLSATTERPFAINSPAIVELRAALANMGSDR